MPIDRAAALRNAEKLLRQGKLDQAIAEYVRVVEDQPRDWNTANVLGDLYIRAGQPDRAVEQFTRIADHLREEGFFSKAGALYKKVLKIRPDHEHALLQSAEVAASQGLLVEARAALNAVAERRRSRRDQRGVAEIRIRLGSLDPGDFEARLNAARARADLGETIAALADLKLIAADMTEKGREADAIEVIREAAAIAPQDEELRERLLAIHIASGDFERARECATTVDQFKALAAALDERGFADHALAALVEASRLDPGDTALKERLARGFVARGDVASAAQFLTIETAGKDPQLLLTLAELRLRSGEIDQGVDVLKRILDEDPSRRESIALVGWNLAEQASEAGYAAVEVAADAAVAQSDWPGAAAALQEFVTRVPNHIPALMRLVEICVDGGLEATMYSAQAQLADAYISAGAAAEARFIAEDLVAREPWERANVERFRQALVLLGEADPDAVIADRLSGQSPFMSTDLSIGDIPELDQPVAAPPPVPEPEPPPAREPEPPPTVLIRPEAVRAEAAAASAPAHAVKKPRRADRDEASMFELSANAVDLESILGEFQQPPRGKTAPNPAEPGGPETGEVDLSVALEDFASDPAAKIHADDMDGVFEQLRGEAAKRAGSVDAEAQYEQALELRSAGRIDEAIAALQTASRAPRLRFQAASLLGRIYRERRALPQAIEWLERAAEAPAPTANEAHLLLYELADALESSGEVARALAICLELQADAGDFKDVPTRIDRLAKVQTRG